MTPQTLMIVLETANPSLLRVFNLGTSVQKRTQTTVTNSLVPRPIMDHLGKCQHGNGLSEGSVPHIGNLYAGSMEWLAGDEVLKLLSEVPTVAKFLKASTEYSEWAKARQFHSVETIENIEPEFGGASRDRTDDLIVANSES